MTPRVLFVQYGNPGAYPPVIHATSILADAGFDVLVLGTSAEDQRMRMDERRGVRVHLMRSSARAWRTETHYARFAAWTAAHAIGFRPGWMYVSDALACPAALLLRAVTRARVVYHEHDAPAAPEGRSGLVVERARRRLARVADLCVLPADARSGAFAHDTGRGDVMTAWNTPLRDEVAAPRQPPAGRLRVRYHGSITPARLPLTVLDAVALVPDVELVVVGYRTIGYPSHVADLLETAAARGISDRVQVLPPVSRADLMRDCARCDVGLSFMPMTPGDVNERAMVGASNKPFDYLACGVALLVSDLPDWRRAYVDGQYGLACDPRSVGSLAKAFAWFAGHRTDAAAMGERGRQRILAEWHYERSFAPVLERMRAPNAACVPDRTAGSHTAAQDVRAR